jgi:signal transduction histidine kinase
MPGSWADAAPLLASLFDGARFELRFSLGGHAAVRVLGGPVAALHAEPPDPAAPWSARAACGEAVGWLLAERAPTDEPAARDALQRAVERHSSLALQRIAAQRGGMTADLLETVTHRLRTDIGALQVIAEGALAVPFEDDERPQVRAEVAEVGAEAQRRLSAAREVMAALHPTAERPPEPLIDALRRELEGAGVAVAVADVDGEQPVVVVPGSGWSACARLLAGALAADARLAGAAVAVRADPAGWAVIVGEPGGEPAPWTERSLGELAHAGAIVVAAGGGAAAGVADGRLWVELTVPAAPSARST